MQLESGYQNMTNYEWKSPHNDKGTRFVYFVTYLCKIYIKEIRRVGYFKNGADGT